MYKEVWKPKIGLGSTARAMHDQHAVNSARMRLTASIKPGKYVCAYEKVCTYKKGAPNNPSLRYVNIHTNTDAYNKCICMHAHTQIFHHRTLPFFLDDHSLIPGWVFHGSKEKIKAL